MIRTKCCPACSAEIPTEPAWFGFVRRHPSRCRCGVRLAYDAAGGVHVVPERAPRSQEDVDR